MGEDNMKQSEMLPNKGNK